MVDLYFPHSLFSIITLRIHLNVSGFLQLVQVLCCIFDLIGCRSAPPVISLVPLWDVSRRAA